MRDTHRFVVPAGQRPHGDHLEDGYPLAPGDGIPEGVVDLTRSKDKQLFDDGWIVEIPDAELTGQALKDRAAELEIEGRSSMTAPELRAAIAQKEKALAEGDNDSEENPK